MQSALPNILQRMEYDFYFTCTLHNLCLALLGRVNLELGKSNLPLSVITNHVDAV